MAEKGMIVENPLELLPLFEGMALLPDEHFSKQDPVTALNSSLEPEATKPVSSASAEPAVQAALAPRETMVSTAVQAHQDQPVAQVESTSAAEPGSAVNTSSMESASLWVLNVWVDENKKHWPDEFKAPLTALMQAVKVNGESLSMDRVQVLNPFVFTDRHGIREWALSFKPRYIVIWANQTNLERVPALHQCDDWDGIPVLRLPAFASVMGQVDHKKLAWKHIKDFFEF
ncbi:MAG: hypothetical protein ACO3DK_01865 [Bacteroidia bacterium]